MVVMYRNEKTSIQTVLSTELHVTEEVLMKEAWRKQRAQVRMFAFIARIAIFGFLMGALKERAGFIFQSILLIAAIGLVAAIAQRKDLLKMIAGRSRKQLLEDMRTLLEYRNLTKRLRDENTSRQRTLKQLVG
jgi:hypothetical protein